MQEAALLKVWETSPNFTAAMLRNSPPGSVVSNVGCRLSLETYCDYYFIDAVFFDRVTDRVHCSPIGQTWIDRIQVALEHENHFKSGLFKEASHLLITRADLRVLVTYPEAFDENPELDSLATVIHESHLADPSFLLITGKRIPSDLGKWDGVEWVGRIYSAGGWVPV